MSSDRAIGTIRRHSSRLAALACLAVAGCGSSESGSDVARYLDPRSDAVVAVDLDYDGGNWEQVKRLYARAVPADDRFTPRTLDAALGEWASEVGLSFAHDVRPLLGGTLHLGVSVDPAAPLSPEARDVLDRLDEGATKVTGDEVRYFDDDGRRLDPRAVEAAFNEQSRSEPAVVATAALRVEEPEALARVLEKLRAKGLEAYPIDGADGARRLAEGVATVGDDTIVAVIPGGGEDADRLLRERLAGSRDGPALPELGDDLVAVRAAPTLLGAWLDREELGRALGTAAGRALRGAEASVRLDEDAGRAEGRVDFDGLAGDGLPLPEAAPLTLPGGEGVASASADQSRTTVFLARLARALYPESRFVQRVEALEQSLGVRFEDEVLRQFAGPSFSVLRAEGPNGREFGARSTLSDPAASASLPRRMSSDAPMRSIRRHSWRLAAPPVGR